jgi:methionine sulfoxide reductase catalytic subunit
MLIKKAPDLRWSDVTPRELHVNRREFLRAAGGVALAAGVAGTGVLRPRLAEAQAQVQGHGPKLPNVTKGPFATDEALTPYEDVTTYNNFYEFGIDKDAPAKNAKSLRTRPWTVTIDGAVTRPGKFAIDDLIKPYQLEERVYRMRCVEGWSMVIPWVGFPLGDLLKTVEPTSKANFVEFTTLRDVKQMPGQLNPVLEWPYVEGLRIDEAMHPLTIMAVGLYGEVLPNQDGAPMRLVVPWKYGFKGIKSIVRIRLVEKQPISSWQKAWSQAYGFYSNVNPDVDHPNHSQARERRIGDYFKRRTLMFNGYADQVAGLYKGMDLKKNY